jgi:RNA polymerase sigma-70 factor (ECF subfamily)
MIVILYENITKLKKPEAFYSWSKTILINCCKQLIKKNKKLVLLEKIDEEPYLEKYEQKEQRTDLLKYMNLLSDEHGEAIRLKYFLDLDYKTIAEILDVPLGTVKSRIFLGLKKLRESMGGEYHG